MIEHIFVFGVLVPTAVTVALFLGFLVCWYKYNLFASIHRALRAQPGRRRKFRSSLSAHSVASTQRMVHYSHSADQYSLGLDQYSQGREEDAREEEDNEMNEVIVESREELKWCPRSADLSDSVGEDEEELAALREDMLEEILNSDVLREIMHELQQEARQSREEGQQLETRQRHQDRTHQGCEDHFDTCNDSENSNHTCDDLDIPQNSHLENRNVDCTVFQEDVANGNRAVPPAPSGACGENGNETLDLSNTPTMELRCTCQARHIRVALNSDMNPHTGSVEPEPDPSVSGKRQNWGHVVGTTLRPQDLCYYYGSDSDAL